MNEARLIVVEADEGLFQEALEELERAGWDLRSGWEAPGEMPGSADRRVAYFGPVESHKDAEAALLTSLHGHSVVARVRTTDALATFIDDLRRVGPVDVRGADRLAEPLDTDQRMLLQLLAEGRTMARAAEALHMSLRSVQRRMHAARTVLGARSTAEAVHIARSRGLC